MRKDILTRHIRDDELKIKMYKIVDICNNVLKTHIPKHSEFLNPFEIKNAIAIVNSDRDLSYKILGGYENAQRAIIYVYPYYLEPEDQKLPLSFLRADGNFKFSTLSHRSYLGSLMSLGIKREKIGDLLVHSDFCQMIVDSDIEDFLIYNFDSVSHNRIKLSKIRENDILIPKQEYIDKQFSVSSLRIDNIIAGAFDLSRSDALKYITSEYVFVDYEKIDSPSKIISESSLISVRKKGKFIIDNIGDGLSKKGKIRVRIKIFK